VLNELNGGAGFEVVLDAVTWCSFGQRHRRTSYLTRAHTRARAHTHTHANAQTRQHALRCKPAHTPVCANTQARQQHGLKYIHMFTRLLCLCRGHALFL
jgi:hypothetical protein